MKPSQKLLALFILLSGFLFFGLLIVEHSNINRRIELIKAEDQTIKRVIKEQHNRKIVELESGVLQIIK